MSADGLAAREPPVAPPVAGGARKRILFVAENVSLAQVVRLRVLAGSLDPQRYEVVFACSELDPLIFDGTAFQRRIIYSMTAAQMHRRMAWGRRLYGMRTLARYVRDDLALLEDVQPALVVGDLRLSLLIAAPKLAIPHAALINAYWSPHAERDSFPLPVHPVVRMIGPARVAPHVGKAMPLVLDHFASPVNALRRRYGLPALGNLLEVLTSADHTLFPDVPELVPLTARGSSLEPTQHFLGPVLWSPDVPLPRELDAEPSGDPRERDRSTPLVYVTLGSSGDVRLVDALLSALGRLPVRVLLATAGRYDRGRLPRNVIAARYAPGSEAARRSALVICNGGSSTGYQALHEGVPVLGLPFNFDQSLAMQAIERAGAGLAVLPHEASAERLMFAITRLLTDPSFAQAAQRIGRALTAVSSRARFPALIDRILAKG
jgi:UDP:flavonoid glycosyltransferase YjiC (YdhE family)